jgi:hypothetical protein
MGVRVDWEGPVTGMFGSPDMSNIAEATPEERAAIEAFFTERSRFGVVRGRERGHYYQLTADSILLEHRPDYAKRFYDGLQAFPNRLEQTGAASDNAVQLTLASLQHLPMYILYGWETGIYNEFKHLQSRALTKAQVMELVLFAQLQAGIRGQQLVYNAVSRLLVDYHERPGPVPLPEGWAADPDAFTSGLDLSSRDLTAQDRRNVITWYEQTLGEVPNSATFAMTYHPEFYKWYRARWEMIFQRLPKQAAPYIMLRQHLLTGNGEALREAALLGKAWGISKEWIVHGLTVSAWYTGFEGLYVAHAALNDLLRDWE